MRRRLRNDFKLSMIMMLGALAAGGVLPFAVYRFVIGDILMGIIDSVMVVCIVSVMTYAWRTGRADQAGLMFAVFNTIGGVAVATVAGYVGLFWLYIQFLANFLLVPAGLASIITALGIIFLAVHGAAFDSTLQMISFTITSLLVSLVAFVFAYRAELQRRQLEVLAAHDPLTGVGNRRVLNRELGIAVASAQRSRISYGLIMLDLDHFKQVNDRHGHETGDQVLLDLVRLVERSTRGADRLFRFGGEEFVVLLPDVNLSGLHKAAENLRQKIEMQLRSPSGPVTASLGVALLRPEESWQAWLQRADVALYSAKRGGRNRTVTAEADLPVPSPEGVI